MNYNTFGVLRRVAALRASARPPVFVAGSGGGLGTDDIGVASGCTAVSEGRRNRIGSAA